MSLFALRRMRERVAEAVAGIVAVGKLGEKSPEPAAAPSDAPPAGDAEAPKGTKRKREPTT